MTQTTSVRPPGNSFADDLVERLKRAAFRLERILVVGPVYRPQYAADAEARTWTIDRARAHVFPNHLAAWQAAADAGLGGCSEWRIDYPTAEENAAAFAMQSLRIAGDA